MLTLLDQLIALTGQLGLAAGVAAATLAELRRFLAAALIQQNPGFVPVVPNPALDPAINEAAIAGAELAAQLDAAGIRLRFLLQPYLEPETAADKPAQVFGPFIDGDLALVQFSFFETARFRRLLVDQQVVLAIVRETVLLLPEGTRADAGDPRRFEIPPGTVWLLAKRLVADAPGFVALRVARGSLVFDAAPQHIEPGAHLMVTKAVPWSLEVEPEPAPPGHAAGSDADALSVLLPTRLVVHSSQPAAVEGALGLAGFGTDLRFEAQTGGPVAGGDAIGFPFETAGSVWSIAGNRSPVFQLDGDAVTVAAAVWSLPLASADVAEAGEAAHGGSASLLLREGPVSRLAGTSGACSWRDTVLTANARGLDMKGRRAGASVAADVVLWGAARSDLRFGAEQLGGLRHASRRGGADIAALHGGQVGNRWDLPRAASGKPFAFAGVADSLSLIAEADGLRRIACAASLAEADRQSVQGFVLENLYLHVHPARRMAFVGSGSTALHAQEGAARLLFDVRLAQPMLPDPYATNWSVGHLDVQLAESAFSAVLRWVPDAAPALQARLEPQALLSFPDAAPADEPERLRVPFDTHLGARPTRLALLDLSSRDHHFGVALEPLSDPAPQIDGDNRLAVQLGHVRLLMQPQVHWEPVEVIPNPAANAKHSEQVISRSPGGSSLVGARSVSLVPVLPGRVGARVIEAAQGSTPAAALFALPFGLRAFVRLERLQLRTRPTGMQTQLHRPVFNAPAGGDFSAAMQLRLIAVARAVEVPPRPIAAQPASERGMPGAMLQTDNLAPNPPPTNGLANVLTSAIASMVNVTFQGKVPLHQADLSGYGLSTFSRWRRDPTGTIDVAGVSQVRFDVMMGRTAYEVIEVRSRMMFAQCRVVRTIVMERRNSGRVQRFDSGWNAIDDGEFKRYVAFDTGVVPALRNIRRIRILDRPEIVVPVAPDTWVWQAVLFDADAEVEGLTAGGANGRVPVYDHPGYIQIKPVRPLTPAMPGDQPLDVPKQPHLEALLAAVGGPVGGPIDCAIRLGNTLAMQLASLQVDLAPADPGGTARFFVAVYGSLSLPRVAQWSAVRIDGATQDVSPVHARRGVPVIRRKTESHYTLIDPADALTGKPKVRYGLLMTTAASRVLYPQPTVHPPAAGGPGELKTDPPRVADPYALAQASGAFPRPGFALQCKEAAAFSISAADDWAQLVPEFSFFKPVAEVAKGAEWGLARSFKGAEQHIKLGLNTLLADVPWEVAAQQADRLALTLDGFDDLPLFFLESAFADSSGALPGLGLPSLSFGKPLDELKKIVDSLNQFIDLPFDVEVGVTAGSGPSPSFIVSLDLRLRIPSTLNERIDIGVGKFHGVFEMLGELEAALNGSTRGKLTLEFSGDVQQGIIPPLIYAGGIFRFVLHVSDSGPPLIELGLGTTASLGGALIKNLVELEVTVRYGYTLIPQTLQPGVMLGLDARAKLLGGLLGLSFSADAMARIQRVEVEGDNSVTLWCELRVAATVQVAWFLEEEMDLRTQFEQDVPLAPFLLVAGANPWFALASEVL